MICVNSKYLGTEHCLLLTSAEDEFAWVDSPPIGAWTWGFSDSGLRLEDAARILGIETEPLVPLKYAKAARCVWDATQGDIKWQHLLPSQVYSTQLKMVLAQAQKIHQSFDETGYLDIFVMYHKLLNVFEPAAINETKWREYLKLEKSAAVRTTLNSFAPNKGFARLPVYNYNKTSTGRAIIKSGPRILTLPVAYRDIIIPSQDDKVVVQVDFVSLEPRVALSSTENIVDENDIYEYLVQHLFKGNITRPQAKLATLCALYGVSLKKLQSMIPDQNAAITVRKIKDFFNVKSRIKALRAKIENKEMVQNFFGRPLRFEQSPADHILFSHFIQSSAVDVSMLGFYKLLDELAYQENDIRPLFILHDALILEIPPRMLEDVSRICKKGITIEKLGVFPLEMEKLGR